MPKHEHYEELCALAAGGQLSESEERELAEHCENCDECRTAFQEFRDLLGELPPLDDTVDLLALREAEEQGHRKRFIERARKEGRRFTGEAERGIRPPSRPESPPTRAWFRIVPKWDARWALATVVTSLGVGVIVYFGHSNETRRNSVTEVLKAPSAAALSTQSTEPSPRVPSEEEPSRVSDLQRQMRAAEHKISLLEAENSALGRQAVTAEKDRETALSQKTTSDAAAIQATEAKRQLEEQLEQNVALLAEARNELKQLRTEHTVTLASLATERRSVDELSASFKAQSESLDREKELLTAGRDVTNLMGARNLHVLDVYDGDGAGKNRKSYSRIFYTEGKSLIFYAFDLDERKLMNAKYTYKVWGERQASPASVKGLGILYMDDKAQKRWALKVDDPQQLSEIDSVFVTLEPRDGGNTPHGQKLLFAFLGTSANHP